MRRKTKLEGRCVSFTGKGLEELWQLCREDRRRGQEGHSWAQGNCRIAAPGVGGQVKGASCSLKDLAWGYLCLQEY